MTFEEKIARLDEIVNKMEGGQLKLGEMLSAFEEGRKLEKECRKELDSIRLKIEKVTATGVEPLENVGEEKENG